MKFFFHCPKSKYKSSLNKQCYLAFIIPVFENLFFEINQMNYFCFIIHSTWCSRIEAQVEGGGGPWEFLANSFEGVIWGCKNIKRGLGGYFIEFLITNFYRGITYAWRSHFVSTWSQSWYSGRCLMGSRIIGTIG